MRAATVDGPVMHPPPALRDVQSLRNLPRRLFTTPQLTSIFAAFGAKTAANNSPLRSVYLLWATNLRNPSTSRKSRSRSRREPRIKRSRLLHRSPARRLRKNSGSGSGRDVIQVEKWLTSRRFIESREGVCRAPNEQQGNRADHEGCGLLPDPLSTMGCVGHCKFSSDTISQKKAEPSNPRRVSF